MRSLSLLPLLFCAADADDGVAVEASGRGHPWPKPGKQLAGWPIFKDKKELEANAWGKYYKMVYGAVPDTYPVHPGDLWLLFEDKLKEAKVTHMPKSEGPCPHGKAGERYVTNNAMQPPGTSYVWHPYPYQAIPSHTKVEVSHKMSTHGDSARGAWMMYAPGSGIYFDIGKTSVFEDHGGAMKHFGVHTNGWDWKQANPKMAAAAVKKGIDSIQFLAHPDPQYICTKDNPYGKNHYAKLGLHYMGLEIVSTRLFGVNSCMKKDGTPHQLWVGWGGKFSCHCKAGETFLNCDGKAAEILLNNSGVIV